MKTRKISKFFALLMLSVFILNTSFSQDNYLAGQVITLSGDTLNGQINYHNWTINPNKIGFCSASGGKKNMYTPTEIKGFVVSDEIYQSAIVEVEISPTQTSDLGFESKLHITIDTIFLQTIIEGTKSLYYYKNNNSNENFYTKQNGIFNLLIHKVYLEEGRGNYVKKENNKYLGQLAIYLGNCSSTQTMLKNLRYNLISLRGLFHNYYKCTSSDIEFDKKDNKVSVNIGALAGVSLTSLEFDGSAFSTRSLVNTDFSNSFNLSLGFFFDVIAPKNLKKWSLNNELVYSSYSTSGLYTDLKHIDNYTIYSTTFEYSYLKMNNLIRFKYPTRNSYVYINTGISSGFPIAQKNSVRKEIVFFSSETIEEGLAIEDTKKLEQGFILGLGVSHNKLSFELRYEKGNGLAKPPVLGSTAKRYFFLLGYQLN